MPRWVPIERNKKKLKSRHRWFARPYKEGKAASLDGADRGHGARTDRKAAGAALEVGPVLEDANAVAAEPHPAAVLQGAGAEEQADVGQIDLDLAEHQDRLRGDRVEHDAGCARWQRGRTGRISRVAPAGLTPCLELVGKGHENDVGHLDPVVKLDAQVRVAHGKGKALVAISRHAHSQRQVAGRDDVGPVFIGHRGGLVVAHVTRAALFDRKLKG